MFACVGSSQYLTKTAGCQGRNNLKFIVFTKKFITKEEEILSEYLPVLLFEIIKTLLISSFTWKRFFLQIFIVSQVEDKYSNFTVHRRRNKKLSISIFQLTQKSLLNLNNNIFFLYFHKSSILQSNQESQFSALF